MQKMTEDHWHIFFETLEGRHSVLDVPRAKSEVIRLLKNEKSVTEAVIDVRETFISLCESFSTLDNNIFSGDIISAMEKYISDHYGV